MPKYKCQDCGHESETIVVEYVTSYKTMVTKIEENGDPNFDEDDMEKERTETFDCTRCEKCSYKIESN
jgi:DNA-directed RNA polymerase subunit RPC12/RpoP